MRDQYGTERGGKCFYTAVPMKHLSQEPLCSPFNACMHISCTPNSNRFNLNGHVRVRDHKF